MSDLHTRGGGGHGTLTRHSTPQHFCAIFWALTLPSRPGTGAQSQRADDPLDADVAAWEEACVR